MILLKSHNLIRRTTFYKIIDDNKIVGSHETVIKKHKDLEEILTALNTYYSNKGIECYHCHKTIDPKVKNVFTTTLYPSYIYIHCRHASCNSVSAMPTIPKINLNKEPEEAKESKELSITKEQIEQIAYDARCSPLKPLKEIIEKVLN